MDILLTEMANLSHWSNFTIIKLNEDKMKKKKNCIILKKGELLLNIKSQVFVL